MDMIVDVSFEFERHRRHVRSEEEKRKIVGEAFEPDALASAVARRHGLNTNLLFIWRREKGCGVSALADGPMAFVPAVISAAPAMASAPSSPSVAGQLEIAFAGEGASDRGSDG